MRVRPPLRHTDPGFELIPQRFQRSMVQVTSPTSLAVDSPQGRKLFVFDRVFGENIEQEGVWEYLHDSVDSFVQGYNVSVLAYGQSGAGKSYTMGTSGPVEQGDSRLMGEFSSLRDSIFVMERGLTSVLPQVSSLAPLLSCLTSSLEVPPSPVTAQVFGRRPGTQSIPYMAYRICNGLQWTAEIGN